MAAGIVWSTWNGWPYPVNKRFDFFGQWNKYPYFKEDGGKFWCRNLPVRQQRIWYSEIYCSGKTDAAGAAGGVTGTENGM